MKLLVTRPAAQADEWVTWLASQGLEAAALPLIDIVPPDDPAPVRAAWRALATRRLAMFVSPNAAQQFFALQPDGMRWPAATLAGSPGPGTGAVLRMLGVPEACIVEPAGDAAQFDSESLWAQLRRWPWQGASVLVVRGESGRDWLADTLRAHGAQVDHVTAYARRAPRPDAAGRALLAAASGSPGEHLWLFSSSEAIDHLADLLPDADWRAAQALATHPRIAARAREAGFGRVLECPPARDAVLRCLQSAAPADAKTAPRP